MKLAVLSKATSGFQTVPIRIPVLFFSGIENNNWVDKIILTKKKKRMLEATPYLILSYKES